MDICFEGIGQVVATFRTKDDTLTAGMAVTLTGNDEVGLSKEDGKPLCGVTVGAAREGAVAVQISGVAKVGCSGGEDLNAGWQELACDGKGGVTTADGNDGVKFLVLAVDEAEDKDENGDKNKKSVVVRL